MVWGLRTWLAKLGGVIVMCFGLHMIGVFRIPFLEYMYAFIPNRSHAGEFIIAINGVFSQLLGNRVWANPGIHYDFLPRMGGFIFRESAGRPFVSRTGDPHFSSARGWGLLVTAHTGSCIAKFMRITEIVYGYNPGYSRILLFLFFQYPGELCPIL